MKPATLLAFPVLALAAAAPKVEERQLGSTLPVDVACILGLISDGATCLPNPPTANLNVLTLLLCPVAIVNRVLSECLVLGLPAKN
ncbi:hypothetical protein ACHAPT_010481 [Fusarium lateritium]